jgi:putative ABC transport system permease protein
VGDTIKLATPAGTQPFEVIATYAAIETGGYRSVVVTMQDGRDRFGIGAPHAVYVALRADQKQAEVLGRLARDLEAEAGTYYVQDNAEIRALMQSQFDSVAVLFNGILAIIAIVGVLGLANTLVVSVLARVRETGVLRAVGVQRRELTWLTSAEAVSLTATGLVLATPLGAFLGWLLVRGFTSGVGAPMHFRYPWFVVPIGLLLALVFAALASILPARRAVRLDPVAALRFE